MIEIGKYNDLKVVKKSEEGLYLDGNEYGELLLPSDQGSSNYCVGEEVEVFLYFNAGKKLTATIQEPYATVGEFACLKVVAVLDMGAFLDWGLPKDLFVPAAEQQETMEEGRSYVVYVYKDDKRNQVAASSLLDDFMEDSPATFQENDKVDLLICHQTKLGFNAIVDNAHWGLLYKDEIFQDLKYGQRMEGFIKKIREDGKIDLSLHTQGYQKMDNLEENILKQMNEKEGVLKVFDKSSPEKIYELFSVSKKKFKMALGSLYKAKRIIIEDDHIRTK